MEEGLLAPDGRPRSPGGPRARRIRCGKAAAQTAQTAAATAAAAAATTTSSGGEEDLPVAFTSICAAASGLSGGGYGKTVKN